MYRVPQKSDTLFVFHLSRLDVASKQLRLEPCRYYTILGALQQQANLS